MADARGIVTGALVGAAVATAVAWGMRDAAPPDASGALAALAARVDAEAAARRELASDVGALRAEVAALEAERGSASPRTTPAPGAGPAGDAPHDAALDRAAARAGASLPGSLRFDEDALVAGGLRRDDAQRLRERWETAEMDRLYLRDRATREGWLGTKRFADEAQAIEARVDAVRGEQGDEVWDWFLFGAGRPNRVRVEDVLERSPAREAGLEAGDVILRYDGQRIFTPGELQQATTEGRAGDVVVVEVARGAETRRIDLPRGPLGVRLGMDRARPPPR